MSLNLSSNSSSLVGVELILAKETFVTMDFCIEEIVAFLVVFGVVGGLSSAVYAVLLVVRILQAIFEA